MRRVALAGGMLAGLALVLVGTLAVFGLPVVQSLDLIYQGALGSRAGIGRSLVAATPMMLTGLGVMVAWRAGMFNIGGEGQFVIGGLLGAWLYKLVPGLVPGALNLGILAASALGGALYGALAGWLQVKRGVQVVISTILLNFVALQVLDWAVSGPLQESKKQLPLTDRLPDAAMLQRFDLRTDLHSGLFLALVVAGVCWVFLYRTAWGFRLRWTGESPSAARAQRMPVSRVQLASMAISGALCGLAGGVEYTGLTGQIGTGFAQQWGFVAIPVALLGGLHPLGVVGTSLVFGALFAGTDNLARFTFAGSTILFVIQAVAVLAVVAAPVVWKSVAARHKAVPA